MYFSLPSSSTSTQHFIWCWCMLFSVFSIFNCFRQDTSHLSSVRRWTCHCYAIVHSLAQGVGQRRTCVFVVFHYHFHMAGCKDDLDGGGPGATLWWFGELVREVGGRGEEVWWLLFGSSSFLKNWTDVAPLGRSRSNKRFPKLASTTIFWEVQSVKRRTRGQEIWKCLRAAGMI